VAVWPHDAGKEQIRIAEGELRPRSKRNWRCMADGASIGAAHSSHTRSSSDGGRGVLVLRAMKLGRNSSLTLSGLSPIHPQCWKGVRTAGQNGTFAWIGTPTIFYAEQVPLKPVACQAVILFPTVLRRLAPLLVYSGRWTSLEAWFCCMPDQTCAPAVWLEIADIRMLPLRPRTEPHRSAN
jgi:hypothetical protein